MKKNCVALFALLILLGISAPAKAVMVQVTGSLNFQVATWNPFIAAINDGNPFWIDVNPTTGAFSLPASIYQAHASATNFDLPSSMVPLGPVTLTGQNKAGAFGPTWVPAPNSLAPMGNPCNGIGGVNVNNCVPGNGFGGIMGLQVNAHLYSGAPTLVTITPGMVPLLTLPLSMFGDYNANIYQPTPTFPVAMSAWGNGWTTGVAYVTNNTVTNSFSNANLATVTGHFWDGSYITATGSTINLVTSAFIREFNSTNIPVTAVMSLVILPIPEPSTALLLGAGLLGLVVAGNRKRSANV